MPLLLTEKHVETIVRKYGASSILRRLIQDIGAGFKQVGRGEIVHHQRRCFSQDDNLIEWMPTKLQQDSFVMKVVSYFPENPDIKQLPTIDATIMECDFTTGQLQAFVGGRLLTAMRTGAASAVASSWLAKPDSQVLGLVGAGAQAVTQAHALCLTFPIQEILVFDISEDDMNSLSERLGFLNVSVTPSDLSRIEQEADIICTATSTAIGADPVLSTDKLKDHVHINAVGSDFPGKKELPADFVRKTFIATDFLEQARVEGECQSLSDADLAGGLVTELAEVSLYPEHFSHLKKSQTIFDSTGIAMEDAIASALMKQLAKESNVGILLPQSMAGLEPKNPYSDVLLDIDTRAVG